MNHSATKRVFLFMITALLLLGSGSVASNSVADLGDFVEEGMSLWQVPGMAVSVVTSEEVLFSEGFGQTSIEDGQAVGEHTLFANASTTKAMVAAGLLILEQDGKLTLDDRVTRYIPELHFNSAVLTEQITIRDLLAHRTGLPGTDFWTFFLGMPMEEQITRLESVAAQNPLREGFIYQNTMYELAGLVIERVSGQRWDHFLRDRLWRPIGMNETFGSRSQAPENLTRVLPHDVVENELSRVDFSLPPDLADAAGSAWTSIHDMSLWAQFLLRGGQTASGEQILSAESMEDMFKPQQLIPVTSFYPTASLTEPNWTSYGLGWFQQDFQGRKIDFHTGSLNGLIAIIGLDRANDKAMVVLGNRDHAEMRHAVLWQVMDDNGERDWNQEIWDLYEGNDDDSEARWAQAENARLKNTSPSLPLENYSGKYASSIIGEVELVEENGNLVARWPKSDMSIRHWHVDTFLIEYPPWNLKEFVDFSLRPDGSVGGLSMFNMDFERSDEYED